MGTSSVRRWVKHFKDGNTDIASQPYCGQLRSSTTEQNEQKVNMPIKEDPRVTAEEIAAQLSVGHHAIQEMVATKVCSHLHMDEQQKTCCRGQ
jgi:transposase